MKFHLGERGQRCLLMLELSSCQLQWKAVSIDSSGTLEEAGRTKSEYLLAPTGFNFWVSYKALASTIDWVIACFPSNNVMLTAHPF